MHGTHVASVLFGDPAGPVAGIIPACRGLLIPVFADAEAGDIVPCSEIAMARAILAAVEQGANVINISAGRLSGTGTAGGHLSDAVASAVRSGVLIVAAAGNEGCACHHVPAALPSVLAVGAMDANGEPVGFSNWGPAYRQCGVLAPGTDVIGAAAGGGVVAMSGTSFATPFVAGAAALLMAKLIEAGKQPDGRVVLQAILDGADRCDIELRGKCERFLTGGLNIAGALRRIAGPSTSARPSMHSGSNDRRDAMSEGQSDTISGPETAGSNPSMETMMASLKAMEGMVGELSRRIGEMRLSGVAPPSRPASALPRSPIRPPSGRQHRPRAASSRRRRGAARGFCPGRTRTSRATASCSCPPRVAMPAPRARRGSSSTPSAGSATTSAPRRGWTRSRAR